eukprot:TRINITY_DN20438_c0_g1_i1.p1 TRINITY_DN20438_c0_g1~~TRINITY_DN20438_c0_g1_i1.p1  ORF type:complete len:209 (+),score=20.67 TRINITY_DN20438_c0_g1_i1:146-772(+)
MTICIIRACDMYLLNLQDNVQSLIFLYFRHSLFYLDQTAYIELYLSIDLELALSHNDQRGSQDYVAPDIIKTMYNRIQIPSRPESICYTATNEIDIQSVWASISAIWRKGPVLQVDVQQKQKDHEITSNNLIHQLDLKLRKNISVILQSLPSPSPYRSSLAKELTSLKLKYLSLGRNSKSFTLAAFEKQFIQDSEALVIFYLTKESSK